MFKPIFSRLNARICCRIPVSSCLESLSASAMKSSCLSAVDKTAEVVTGDKDGNDKAKTAESVTGDVDGNDKAKTAEFVTGDVDDNFEFVTGDKDGYSMEEAARIGSLDSCSSNGTIPVRWVRDSYFVCSRCQVTHKWNKTTWVFFTPEALTEKLNGPADGGVVPEVLDCCSQDVDSC